MRQERSRVVNEDGDGGDGEDARNLEDADAFSETTSVGGGSLATSTKSKSTLATRQTNR